MTGPDLTITVSRGSHVPEVPVVSVFVPVVSAHGMVDACLDSITRSHPSVEVEVVVVANGLGDEALSSLRGRGDIVLVRSAVNRGFSGGNNLAAKHARGRYVLLLNDDSVIEPGYVDRLLTAVQRGSSIAAAGGTILSVDGTLQEAGSVLWRDGWVAHVGAGKPWDATPYHYVRDADYISANGLLVDRRAWDAVGGLDERYFPAYYEDVDLCLALRQRGYRVVYEPRARLAHSESQSTESTFRNFLLVRNRARLVAKWPAALQGLGEHPEPVDEAAIDAAVLRGQRSKGRVLVAEDSGDPRDWKLAVIQALVDARWSVMVSVPGGGSGSADREAIRERLVDLGVDVREGRFADLLSRYGRTLEAVLVSERTVIGEAARRRPDGSQLPFLRHDESDPDAMVRRVAAMARTTSDRHEPRADAPDDGVGTREGGLDVSQQSLDFSEAESVVRREYVTFLEDEVAHLQAVAARTGTAFEELEAAFDEKERYIDSLLSVRFKKWIVGRIPRRSS